MLRTFIINYLIRQSHYRSYLELAGAERSTSFDNVQCEHKVLVAPEPARGATFQVTSDRFFAQNSARFDLIFIDALHYADQVYSDIVNSLDALTEHGTIVCHDLLPTSEIEQTLPRKHWLWTGDGWKAWVRLRMERDDLEMYVVDADCGCGIIRKGRQRTIEVREPLTWESFQRNRSHWLNIIPEDEFLARERRETRGIADCGTRRSLDGRPLFVFIHVGRVGRWTEILTDQWRRLEESGLVEEADRIYYGEVGETGPDASTVLNGSKTEQLYFDPDASLFELTTFEEMKKVCEGCPDARVLYMHTKGASRPHGNVDLWRRLLEYWVVGQRDTCVRLLDDYHTVGVNLVNDGVWEMRIGDEAHCWHYSGNFWWARASHVASLPAIPRALVRSDPRWYWLVERLVLQPLPFVRALEVYGTGPRHLYSEPVHPEEYENRTPRLRTIDRDLNYVSVGGPSD